MWMELLLLNSQDDYLEEVACLFNFDEVIVKNEESSYENFRQTQLDLALSPAL